MPLRWFRVCVDGGLALLTAYWLAHLAPCISFWQRRKATHVIHTLKINSTRQISSHSKRRGYTFLQEMTSYDDNWRLITKNWMKWIFLFENYLCVISSLAEISNKLLQSSKFLFYFADFTVYCQTCSSAHSASFPAQAVVREHDSESGIYGPPHTFPNDNQTLA